MIANVSKSPKLDAVGFPPLASPTLSTNSRNSPSYLSPKPKNVCPCHHILVSKDSQHCALCDRIIPEIKQLLEEREQRLFEITKYQHLLAAKEQKSKGLELEITTLSIRSKELDAKLNSTMEESQSLKKDIALIEQKYQDEQKATEQAKQEKINIENELEELSQKLFEEANSMVADEKQAKNKLEQQYKKLEQELMLALEQMKVEDLQLKELRHKISQMSLKEDSASISTDSEQSVCSEKKASRDIAGFFHHAEQEKEGSDPLMLEEFSEFLKAEDKLPVSKLHTLVFMKNCLLEDIEPCLRFGPHSRLSTRKLSEAILLNTCFIEEAPKGYSQEQQAKRLTTADSSPLKISAARHMIWERLSNTQTGPFTGCQACGRNTTQLPYRFRISVLDDWGCIDRYCRDRLVAVCEFYVFIRNVRQGYYSGRDLPDLYCELVRLKLQMFYARMGTLSQTLQQLGVKGDTIGTASAPNMVIPPPTLPCIPKTMQKEDEQKELPGNPVGADLSD
ncbi:hypothetical protein K501DRAFT_182633 [Backusella circina FSU 941]|nr:hypothetical protein K501DRAFT_182633 [Backusella circina FSU 941]